MALLEVGGELGPYDFFIYGGEGGGIVKEAAISFLHV